MEQTVLGYLAGTGWFGRHGEVALTGGLAVCLTKDPAAGTGLLDLVRERTNVAIAGPLTWQAESASEGGRVDIDAVKEGTHAPVLRIEGKVFAPFEDRQVCSCVTDQLAKLSDCDIDAGVLAVVLLGACRALDGADVPALTDADLSGAWTGRAGDVQKIVYRVTEFASELLGQRRRWLPLGSPRHRGTVAGKARDGTGRADGGAGRADMGCRPRSRRLAP